MKYEEYCKELTPIMYEVIYKFRNYKINEEELLMLGDFLIFDILDELESTEHYKEYFFIKYQNKLIKKFENMEPKKNRSEYLKQYRKENKEKIKGHRKKYYESHKEQFKEYNSKYYKEHKEELKEYQKKYGKENRVKLNEYQRQYRKKKKEQYNQKGSL